MKDTHAQARAAPPWGTYAPLSQEQAAVFRQAGIGLLHAQLLFNRGVTTPEAMRRFLEARLEELPDPLALVDMPRVVRRVERALARGEHITVFGDFDADGVTSAALLTRVLRALGHPEERLNCTIPHRVYDARGLSKEALDVISAVWEPALVIAADCGSSDVEAVDYAKTLGIDVIITDHHHPPAVLPAACALVNPWRADGAYGERSLCGVGVAFKLAQALLRADGREQEAQEYLDLVAVGTIGDVAPLLGENHTLARRGLEQLNRTGNAGLRALMRYAALVPGGIRERDVAYGIAPRINAAGRMEDAYLAYRLLVTEDEAQAQALAGELEELNALRRQRTDALVEVARTLAQGQAADPVVLVGGASAAWPEGIIGLVAGRLSDELGRPVFVLSAGKESSRCSARSGGDFNIIEALAARPELFEAYGGHEQAAGFTIANTRIEELREHLFAWATRPAPQPASAGEDGAPADTASATSQAPGRRMVDLIVGRPEALDSEVYGLLRQLAPFGSGNPEPVFRMNGVTLTRRWLSRPDSSALRVRLQANNTRFSGTFAGGRRYLASLAEGARVDVIFNLDLALSARGGTVSRASGSECCRWSRHRRMGGE